MRLAALLCLGLSRAELELGRPPAAVGVDPTRAAFGMVPGRKLNDAAIIHRTPIFGSIHEYAYYFVDALVGTPPQIQSVILDSGSSILAFSCSSCTHCGKHIDKPFKVEASSTGEWLRCDDKKCMSTKCNQAAGINHCSYSQNYSEGSSLYGHYISEYIGLNKPEGMDPDTDVHMVRYDYVGCHTRETNLFTTQKASGIMGIAPPKDGKQAR